MPKKNNKPSRSSNLSILTSLDLSATMNLSLGPSKPKKEPKSKEPKSKLRRKNLDCRLEILTVKNQKRHQKKNETAWTV